MKRFLWLGFVLLLHLICTGCGDMFRPIIIPNPPTFPNPAAAHSVVAISDNGTTIAGSVMVIDVSGDSIASVADCTTPLCIGIAPVHAVQQTAGQALVVNQSSSLSKVNFSSITSINSTTTITLPAGSAPNFVAVAPNQTTAYVTLPNLNEGGGTISAFNTVGPSARTIRGALTSSPVWLSARSDSQVVYVLEANGTLAYISITSTAGPDTLTESTISIPNATTMIYDGNKNRLYIPGGQQMAIVDVTGPVPQLMKTVPIPPFSLLNLASVPGTAVAAAALPDGSRAYVGSYAALPSQVNISSVLGEGTTGTYAYTLTAGHDLTPGVTVTVTGTDTQQVSGFDGT